MNHTKKSAMVTVAQITASAFLPSRPQPGSVSIKWTAGATATNTPSAVNQPISGLKTEPMTPEAQIAARNPEARPIRRSSKRRMLEKARNALAKHSSRPNDSLFR